MCRLQFIDTYIIYVNSQCTIHIDYHNTHSTDLIAYVWLRLYDNNTSNGNLTLIVCVVTQGQSTNPQQCRCYMMRSAFACRVYFKCIIQDHRIDCVCVLYTRID